MRRVIFILLCGICFVSCSERSRIISDLKATEKKFKDHTGFMLYDPVQRKTLVDFNSANYFSPASNTKIFTLFTALKILGDSVPAFHYTVRNDSLILWGTGDPSFLYKNVFDNRKVYDFLRNSPQRLFFSQDNFKADAWGAGWAWDDFSYAYSAERSPLPMYGNVEIINKTENRFLTLPTYFQNHFIVGDSTKANSKMERDIESNQVTFYPSKRNPHQKTWKVAYHYSSDLLVELLSDTLKRLVEEVPMKQQTGSKLLKSIPSDSLYAVMMKNSDNFIAEQLLLLCAGQLSDTLRPEIAIRYAKKYLLQGSPDELVWVDGSGLSRYNLFTPRSIVYVWQQLYDLVPRQRLFSLLAIGGQKGTLSDIYKSATPFLFGKTGSFSNNSTLSGFLITKKGRVLIFSFMNNNYASPYRDIRNMMQTTLTSIRDKY